jgi:hypothetical protein
MIVLRRRSISGLRAMMIEDKKGRTLAGINDPKR